MRKPLVWDAIIAWKNVILERDIYHRSKTMQLSHMATLIKRGLFDLEQLASEFIKIKIDEKLQIINSQEWTEITKQSKRRIFRSFYRFAKQKKIKQTAIAMPLKEGRDTRKAIITELMSSSLEKAQSQRLTKNHILRLLEEMNDINPRDSLIAWMMWELKVTVHQILNLSISDLDSCYGALRKDLKKCIQVLVKGKEGLVFSTDRGKKVHPAQLVRTMKLASKRAKLPLVISPRILSAYAIAYEKKMRSL